MKRLLPVLTVGACLMTTPLAAEPIVPTPAEAQAVAFMQQDEAWFVAHLKGPREVSEGHTLDPRLQYVLENVTRPAATPAVKAQMRAVYASEAGRTATRAALDRYWATRTAPVEGVLATDRSIPTRGGDLPLRIFVPAALQGVKSAPVLVYYHGGGFMFGSLDAFDPSLRALARDLKMIVVAPGYRLAPEHPYPAAHQDAADAWAWVAAHAAEFGGDVKRLSLGGDSAGGTLALSVALKQKKAATPPAGLLLYYPGVDRVNNYPSMTELGSGYGLDADNLEYLAAQVYPAGTTPPAEDASPMQADLKGLPATVIVTAGFDPLKDSQRAFADKLSGAGVTVKRLHYPSLIHAFLQTTAYVPAAQKAQTESATLFAQTRK
ncbi:alpha/beta hydrolase [Asticcacaulis sp. DXS10W]|uniref:Alpha/beta hydrolase n=1 Tax=Asticcacaulis currens TaxID=2984210 RepID=A0ABT5IHX1_9CAUL|nr:alpha/beta hydrolase [Asticcacaulis currens]MDC7695066.1 alpha/beta hydrolase [Asticcacaulis currens]